MQIGISSASRSLNYGRHCRDHGEIAEGSRHPVPGAGASEKRLQRSDPARTAPAEVGPRACLSFTLRRRSKASDVSCSESLVAIACIGEISQILVARTLAASHQPAGAPAQGVMSTVLGSLVAVASHARSVVPSFRKDVATIFDRAAPTSARAGATASLVVKVIVVLVLGYAAWQEWNQHIISATAIAEQQARKARAEADAATDCTPTMKYLKEKAEAMKAGLPIPPAPKCAP
jgi:hypothetical protein